MQRGFCFFRTLALSGLVSVVVTAGASAQVGGDPAIRDHCDVEKWSRIAGHRTSFGAGLRLGHTILRF